MFKLSPPSRRKPTVLGNEEAVYQLLRPEVRALEQEAFWVMGLNVSNVCVHLERISLGTANTVAVHPRDVFRAAIRGNAYGVLVAHNHPSGYVDPSDEDVVLTKRLVGAGYIIGIPVIDHVILSAKRGLSMRRLNVDLFTPGPPEDS